MMFKKVVFYVIILLIGAALITGSASAITIGVNPLSQEVFLGDKVNIRIDISGLGDYSPDSLSTFDLDLDFDDNFLSFDTAIFGDSVLGDQLDIFGLGSITDIYVIPGIGRVNLFEASLDLPSDLDTLQTGTFTLATLSFDTLDLGISPLNVSVNALGDAYGDPLSADILDGSVNVVPEPTSLLLLLLGLAGIVGFRKKFKI